jgi:hypothetical protein
LVAFCLLAVVSELKLLILNFFLLCEG